MKQNQFSSKMKKAGIKGGITTRKGQWEIERTAKLKVQGEDKKRAKRKPLQVKSPEVGMQMVADRASGMTNHAIAQKYGVSDGYVNNALQTLFLKSGKARELLKDILYNNAIAAGMRTRETIGDLSAMQAAVVTGIMTSRAIEVDKHTAGQSADVDFSQLTEIGDLIKNLRGNVALPSDKEGDIIDITAEGE